MSNIVKPQVVAIVGPTCSGKTALSLRIASQLNAEIVACDSRTVYKEMDIGTAKPSKEEQQQIVHHMLDVVTPDQTYTVTQYKQEASNAILDITARNKLPIVCGGTGFYARALLEGLELPAVSPQHELREKLNQLADEQGNLALHNQLSQIDPISAQKINVNDRFRIIRALEVSTVTGMPLSEAATRSEPSFDTVWIGLTSNDRSYLYNLIKTRLEQQLSTGLTDEVAKLLSKYSSCKTLLNTVNYKEFIPYFNNEATLLQATESCVKHNCNLVRKQLVWFRANPKIHWFAVDELGPQELLKLIMDLVNCRIKA